MKKYLYSTEILVPKKDYDKWAVIACDQYTSDKDYWKQVENTVGDTPSALRVVLPEIYLNETEERVAAINASMKDYLDQDVFTALPDSMIYIEREIVGGAIRKGILGAIDLNEYEYEAGLEFCSLFNIIPAIICISSQHSNHLFTRNFIIGCKLRF